MIAPDLTFRGYQSPYTQITSLVFSESKPGNVPIPVLQGDASDDIVFRIYNNWALNSNIATAYNFSVTTYDGASHTASTLPVSQTWLRVSTSGFGENSTIPGQYTSYIGTEQVVGGTYSYIPEIGSSGLFGQPIIRAGSDSNGVGFIEVKSNIVVPSDAPANNYQFVVTCEYEYAT